MPKLYGWLMTTPRAWQCLRPKLSLLAIHLCLLKDYTFAPLDLTPMESDVFVFIGHMATCAFFVTIHTVFPFTARMSFGLISGAMTHLTRFSFVPRCRALTRSIGILASNLWTMWASHT